MVRLLQQREVVHLLTSSSSSRVVGMVVVLQQRQVGHNLSSISSGDRSTGRQ
jgi:hypothetical protein